MLGFQGALLICKLDVCMSLGLLCVVELEDGNSDDFTAASEMVHDGILVCSKVHILDEHTPLVGVIGNG